MHSDGIFTEKALNVPGVIEPESTRRSAARGRRRGTRRRRIMRKVRSMTLRG